LDIQRFYAPYNHPLNEQTILARNGDQKTIYVEQAKSNSKTVWDSSIVLAKYLELLFNKDSSKFTSSTKCLEIGCGCGLPGLLLSYVGCKVVFTDLPEVLHVVQDSIKRNQFTNCQVTSLKWGSDVTQVKQYVPFDIVIATDTMFILEEVDSLFETIMAVSGDTTQIYFAYGRNRYAEELFLEKMKQAKLYVREIPSEELDDTYQCSDVTVLCITRFPQQVPQQKSEEEEEIVQETPSEEQPSNSKRKSESTESGTKKQKSDDHSTATPMSKAYRKLLQKSLKKKLAMLQHGEHHHCDCC